ncbi:hypothetical protein [Mycoplasmopsis sturni]|uniref:hypothetical protein n=1 Tax=Mycoplasmopsis sturni TaxID=39047 RepID=UPI000689EF8A|nr:hypothetical protein [Mycoplasmopsis sturni]
MKKLPKLTKKNQLNNSGNTGNFFTAKFSRIIKGSWQSTVPKFRELGLFQKWTIRRMVLVAILISISVTFTIISSQLVPLIALPTYKFSFIGLPIKITGFIFGPVIGVFVGIISDLLSLLFIPPAAYNTFYTVATAINGLVSGIFGWFFVRFLNYWFSKKVKIEEYEYKIWNLGTKLLKNNQEYEVVKKEIASLEEALMIHFDPQVQKQIFKLEKREQKLEKLIKHYATKIIKYRNKMDFVSRYGTGSTLKNINTVVSVAFLLMIIVIVTSILFQLSDQDIARSKINNRYVLLTLMISGFLTMIIFIIICRFKMSSEKFLVIVPIVVFSAFLELINVPILSYADLKSLGDDKSQSVLFWVMQHVLFSPIKIWFNIFVIYFSYSVISRLINKNSNISYK